MTSRAVMAAGTEGGRKHNMARMMSAIPPRTFNPDIPRQLKEQSDRGAAIIGGSFVEYYLERLLIARMRSLSKKRREDLFDGFGPLAGFSSKIEIAFALNLIGELARSDLQTIKSVRDKFAHEIQGDEWSFAHPWVVAKCNALRLVDIVGAPIWPGGGTPDRKTSRGQFILSVYLLSSQLDGEAVVNEPTLYSPRFLIE
jgi:hypothetical protein